MKRDLTKTNATLAIVGIVVGLFLSIWFGIALVALAVGLHFFVDREVE